MKRPPPGSAIVELVVLAPMLLLLMLGLIQAAAAGNFAIAVSSAARAGVQYGAQNHVTALDTAGMQSAATADANIPGVTAVATSFCQCQDLSASTCGLAGACSGNHQSLYVRVVVTGTMPSVVNYSALPAALQSITVAQTAVMRVTQ